MPELPLQIAVLELRFPGDPLVEVARGHFYQDIRAEFPELYVQHASTDQAPPLQAYQFTAPGQVRSVNIAVNSFAYSVKGDQYKSFDVFLAAFRKYYELFTKHYTKMAGLTRIGLRYINHVPLERNGLGFIIGGPLQIPEISDGKLRNVAQMKETLEGPGFLRVLINSSEPQLPKDKVILDFDYSVSGTVYQPIPLSRLAEYTQIAHDVTKHFFRSLLHSKYLEEVGIR